MRKLRDFISALTTLLDWQDEVERALAQAEENEVAYRKLQEELAAKPQAQVLSLAEYRAHRASA